MASPIRRRSLVALLTSCFATFSYGAALPDQHPVPLAKQAAHSHAGAEPQAPRFRQTLPPSAEQALYDLPESKKPRRDLLDPSVRQTLAKGNATAMAAPVECQDMERLISHSGNELANYIVNLPDYECHYGLFSLNAQQAARAYSPANLNAVASRFVQEANGYDASNRALVNLLIYLRAGYYLASSDVVAEPPASLLGVMRPAIKGLLDGRTLFKANAQGRSTAGETLKLITNMHDEAYYLPSVRSLVLRYTNSATRPNAVEGLREYTAGAGFTGVLTVFYYANGRPEGKAILSNDPNYATALYTFIKNNKTALLGTNDAFQLSDAARETFRFFQYPTLRGTVKPMVQATLASSTMTGNDMELWLAAAEAVKYYDEANCSEYGTCNYETRLADAVLRFTHTCSPSLRIRAQEMTPEQMQASCSLLEGGETYFHRMMKTNKVPVRDDNNTSLEVVVFDDYSNYNKFAGVIFGISTNNGGMYLEGDPSYSNNQARFIAHEASWLRPTFKVWNLEHEYIHYLDGRFDMHGDFGDGTVKPTVWWIEGIAEYLSLKNNNQASIDAARTGRYRLSQIFGNTYSMSDYTARAYRWGYMAARFMMERHRSDVDAAIAKFRVGDYVGYQTQMDQIGTRYDNEFASWVQTASTTGEPPLPGNPKLPACSSNNYLGKGCALVNLSASDRKYGYILLPAGAKNLKLWTDGNSGDVDLYVGLDRYPTPTSYDVASSSVGNDESVSIALPTSGKWYYILLNARQPFTGVAINASYD
ncbi:collagenase [Chitinimonas arctica]|uniref:microbial collagenase n=1 Tax=Chitinimonas arctica TaxID=2594795 RepID=A0A516SK45_9NEIS|nr:M9 family metallopeptidase [Chitinimonas arctica]QDQ28526.1 collagenase [Chitinimonas arctica]